MKLNFITNSITNHIYIEPQINLKDRAIMFFQFYYSFGKCLKRRFTLSEQCPFYKLSIDCLLSNVIHHLFHTFVEAKRWMSRFFSWQTLRFICNKLCFLYNLREFSAVVRITNHPFSLSR